jgi:hypothetical protein
MSADSRGVAVRSNRALHLLAATIANSPELVAIRVAVPSPGPVAIRPARVATSEVASNTARDDVHAAAQLLRDRGLRRGLRHTRLPAR